MAPSAFNNCSNIPHEFLAVISSLDSIFAQKLSLRQILGRKVAVFESIFFLMLD